MGFFLGRITYWLQMTLSELPEQSPLVVGYLDRNQAPAYANSVKKY